jgi:predicted TIM-barrel fold metal-dependent hydrolase
VRIIDVNTFFGTSPRRQVDYAGVVTAARHFDDSAAQPTVQDVDWSLDNLRRIMDRHDIARVVTCSLRGRLYDFVSGNDETLDAASADDRIIPAATVDPRRHFGCLSEVERCADLGFQVFRFFPLSQGWPLTGLPFIRLCETLAEYDPVVMLPAGPWGHQTAVARKIADFGFAVIITGATFHTVAEAMSLAEYSNICWETSGMHMGGAIQAMISEVGAGRVLFGSNSPEYSFEAELNLVTDTGLDHQAQEAVLAGNAARLLGPEHGP